MHVPLRSFFSVFIWDAKIVKKKSRREKFFCQLFYHSLLLSSISRANPITYIISLRCLNYRPEILEKIWTFFFKFNLYTGYKSIFPKMTFFFWFIQFRPFKNNLWAFNKFIIYVNFWHYFFNWTYTRLYTIILNALMLRFFNLSLLKWCNLPARNWILILPFTLLRIFKGCITVLSSSCNTSFDIDTFKINKQFN